MALQRSLSLLVHGQSKAGKSLLGVSTKPPRLLLDVESGARFLPIHAVAWDPRDPPPEADGTWDTAVVAIKEWSDATRAMEWLMTGQHPFVSVTLDSVSELQNRYVEHLAGRQNTVKIDQWGAILREIGGYIRDLRDLTSHPRRPLETVVVTAMSRNIDGVWTPHVQGQLVAILPYLLDIIGYMVVDLSDDNNEIRRMWSRRRPTWVAGERVGGRIPPLLDLPLVVGDTQDEVASKNVTMQLLVNHIFREDSPAIAASHIEVPQAPIQDAPIGADEGVTP